MPRPVKIVGAGFSGLTSAYFLVKRGIPVEIFEAASREGGLIRSESLPSGLVESAANGVLNTVLFEEVAAEIACPLQGVRKIARRRYLYRNGRALRWPLSFFESCVLAWNFFKSRFARGGHAPHAQESVSDWGKRALGAPATQWLVEPALQGIYAGIPQRMSASLVFGRFFSRAARLPKPRLRGSVAPVAGMGDFSLKLRAWLEARGVRFHWTQAVSAELMTSWSPERILVATSARDASRLLENRAPALSKLLAQIEMLPLTTLTAFFSFETSLPRGFGCLFPRDAGITALGALFNTDIFAARGEARSETWIYSGHGPSESEWLARMMADRATFCGSTAAPHEFKLASYAAALPHYTIELEALLPQIARETESAGLYLMGNYLGEIGLARILEKSRRLADEMALREGT